MYSSKLITSHTCLFFLVCNVLNFFSLLVHILVAILRIFFQSEKFWASKSEFSNIDNPALPIHSHKIAKLVTLMQYLYFTLIQYGALVLCYMEILVVVMPREMYARIYPLLKRTLFITVCKFILN